MTKREILGKIIICGIIKAETGLHIGSIENKTQIGGIDKPVVRDLITQYPYIPGSSLKGKIRSLLERMNGLQYNKRIQRINIHACETIREAEVCPVCRIFGSTASGGNNENYPSKIIFRDAFITREYQEILSKTETDLLYTEWKFENSLDRVTSAATPRQLERVPAGTEFDFEVIYEMNDMQYREDIKVFLSGLNLLEKDYLGGNGSRGYGKISFPKISILKIDRTDFGKSKAIQPKEIDINDIDGVLSIL